MSLSTLLIIILVIFLVGGFVPLSGGPVSPETPARPLYPGYGFGFPAGGIIGVILLVLLVLALVGRI